MNEEGTQIKLKTWWRKNRGGGKKVTREKWNTEIKMKVSGVEWREGGG